MALVQLSGHKTKLKVMNIGKEAVGMRRQALTQEGDKMIEGKVIRFNFMHAWNGEKVVSYEAQSIIIKVASLLIEGMV